MGRAGDKDKAGIRALNGAMLSPKSSVLSELRVGLRQGWVSLKLRLGRAGVGWKWRWSWAGVGL